MKKVYFDYFKDEDNGFRKSCMFYRQHFIIKNGTGELEPVHSGQCMLSNDFDCSCCKFYKKCELNYDNLLSLYERITMLFDEVKWLQDVVKELLEINK